jgi:hypothetical protein
MKRYRKLLIKLHNHKYDRHYTAEGYYCFYCGDPADGLDHVPSLSSIDTMDYLYRKRNQIPAVTVACCSQCNGAMSSERLDTVAERLIYLESFYQKVFEKQNKTWSEEEIEELGFSLKNSIRSSQERLQRYVHKIRGIQRRSIMVETHPIFEINEDEERRQIEDESKMPLERI